MTKQSGDPDAGRPLKPSNDTIRIATSLAFPSGTRSEPGFASGSYGPLTATVVEAAIRERALRLTFVPAQLLTDPAWGMLLELLHAEITERRVTSSILCKAAGVQASAGRRWIDALVATGMCTRGGDDRHPDTVELSLQGTQAMHGYFAELVTDHE